MKFYALRMLLIIFLLGLSACDNFCIGGACIGNVLTIKDRVYEPAAQRFYVEVDRDGELNAHTFKLGELKTKVDVLDSLHLALFADRIHREQSADPAACKLSHMVRLGISFDVFGKLRRWLFFGKNLIDLVGQLIGIIRIR